MEKYTSGKIKNIAFLGHSKAGKTSLAEAMLFNTGVINRIGKVGDGNTVCDYDAEEIKRGVSVRASLAAIEYANHKLNILDTPGYFDFIGDMYGALEVCDLGVIAVSGRSGAKVGGEIAFAEAKKHGLPVMFFFNKMDHENADFDKYVDELKDKFGSSVVPVHIPIKNGAEFKGYIDVIENKAYMFEGGKTVETVVPDEYTYTVEETVGELSEAIAEADEELMDKFFTEGVFEHDDLVKGLKTAIIQRCVFPVTCGSSMLNLGVEAFMKFLINYAPSPDDMPAVYAEIGGESTEVERGDAAPLCARVFKTIIDPFVGKLSLLRVYGGKLTKNASVYNVNREANEKISSIITLRGKEKIELDSAVCGDICAVPKLTVTKTGDTFASAAKKYMFGEIKFPEPVYTMAFVPKAKGDEEKISAGLHKMREEDRTIKYENNSEIHQLLVSGLGDQHLDVLVSRLKAAGTDVNVIEPKVSYRETITKKIEAEGKHKKQSGGHGQYGHVKIEFEPCESENLVFEERIFGGSVPKNFHPAVEKGLNEMMSEGIQAGYRVVGVKATLYDGSYHDVDSSEMAFKMAAHLAFKELTKAGPILLEPIGHLEVNIPESYTGDVMGDINKRRGRVLGIEPNRIVAEVPTSEMFKYAIDLRSMTQGRGSYSFVFERYEQAPPQVVQKIISEKENKG